MNGKPRISIITISFNAAEPLRRTIESVNAQTYPFVEHVLVDGGSNDGSVELIEHLARRAPSWLSERDDGISDAFNKGTRLARGDYLCYLNAGDVFASADVLARVAEQIEAAPEGKPTVYFGDFISVTGGVARQHQTSAALADFAWDNPINHQSAFVPRALALAHPYEERLKLGMDYDLWLRLLPVAEFRKLPLAVAVFELGGRSSSPAWEVHGLVMHRVLWHLNRGSRFDIRDLLVLLVRAARFRFNFVVRRLIGQRLSLAIRAAKSRRLEKTRAPQPEQRFA